jgi:hypothetical protein
MPGITFVILVIGKVIVLHHMNVLKKTSKELQSKKVCAMNLKNLNAQKTMIAPAEYTNKNVFTMNASKRLVDPIMSANQTYA